MTLFGLVLVCFNILKELLKLVKEIHNSVVPTLAAKIRFFVDGIERTQMTITDTQKFSATIAPVDAKGNPAQVEAGSVIWSGPDFLTVTPSADGMSADVVAKGPLGSGQVSVSADADLGAGVVTITGTLQVDVIAGQATSFTINTSAPTEQ